MPDFGKLIDKAKQLAGKHPDQVNRGLTRPSRKRAESTTARSRRAETGRKATWALRARKHRAREPGTSSQASRRQAPQPSNRP